MKKMLALLFILVCLALGAIASNAPTIEFVDNPVYGKVEFGAGYKSSFSIHGKNFQAGLVVNVGEGVTINGNKPIENIINLNPGENYFYVPFAIDLNAKQGPRDIIITNPDGQSVVAQGAFIVTEPIFSGMNPNQLMQDQKSEVTITGNEFLSLKGATSPILDLGPGVSVFLPVIVDKKTLKVDVKVDELAAPGWRELTIKYANLGLFGKFPNAFEVLVNPSPTPPTITGINPNQGSPGEKKIINIKGENFKPGFNVDFGSGITLNAQGYSYPFVDGKNFVDSNLVKAAIQISEQAEPGNRDVTLSIPNGTSSTLKDGYRSCQI
jgi:hypothetical protein